MAAAVARACAAGPVRGWAGGRGGVRRWPTRRLHTPSAAATAAARDQAIARGVLRVADEVADAVAGGRPVVALESTIYTHGAMGVDLRLEAIVREHGAVPAVIGVLDGVPTVGLSRAEVARMVAEGARKVSRRDLASLAARRLVPGAGEGQPGHGQHGGTTISGTMVLARLAGLRVFGTGGLGGVHRGWETSMDVSADLAELGRTRVAVVSSGCKGFLDAAATLEYLETQGVFVGTFADGRAGSSLPFPAFWARESAVASPAVVRDEAEAAAVVWAQEQLGIETGLLFANPIPAAAEVPRAEMEAVVDQAVREAAAAGHTGSRNTPFVLQRIRALTGGRSVPANVALVQANVARAARVAVELSALERPGLSSGVAPVSRDVAPDDALGVADVAPVVPPVVPPVAREQASQPSLLVAGSVALDLNCDYHGDAAGPLPRLHTSNPASVVPTVGGVGRNVALAALRLSPPGTRVQLCSRVGDDGAAATVRAALRASGLDTAGVRTVAGARTAHYVAVNGADKNLMVAMADMAVLEGDGDGEQEVISTSGRPPAWTVVDANWSPAGLHGWIGAARQAGARVAFEPVSVAKAARLFRNDDGAPPFVGRVFPAPLVDLATPNEHELAALHAAAAAGGGVVDDPAWFRVIGALGLGIGGGGGPGGARARFDRLASPALADRGVPQQAVQLLPYMPTLVTKLGAQGALLTKLLARDDPLLLDRAAEPYLLVRAPPADADDDGAADVEPSVGGVYMRLFPPAAAAAADVVSVNGAGDTFLGALLAGLVQGGRVEHLVDVAQQAAVRTLRSREAVGELADLAARLADAADRGRR